MTTVLIPTYFAGQMLARCVESLLMHCSDQKITIYRNTIGWLNACNKMMEEIDDDVILLNDDTIILSDISSRMSEFAAQTGAGIVGGVALGADKQTVVNYGIHIAIDGNTAHKHYGELVGTLSTEKQRAVEGSCMFISREVIKKIGYFNPKYGMGYRAELDYAFRARKAGFEVWSTPEAQYIHFQSQTAGRLGIHNDTHEIFMEDWKRDLKLGIV